MDGQSIDWVIQNLEEPHETIRKTPGGHGELVVTTFDHALVHLKLYELTRDPRFLGKAMHFLEETAQFEGTQARWRFSQKVTDIPSDADSTSLALTVFAMAEIERLPFSKEYRALGNLEQFRDLQEDSGGICTYFSGKSNNDTDPVVNAHLAFLGLITRQEGDFWSGIKRYLNDQVKDLKEGSKTSEYFPGSICFAKSMAKLSAYNPDFIGRATTEPLDTFLLTARPANTLEVALLSIGCSYRGLTERADGLNKELEEQREPNGAWGFAMFYQQRTPRFDYGSEINTTLFAIEALSLQDSPIELVGYS
ncbi:hypothetical protein ACFL1B_01360 [Nanoarchaeota archaeon]